MIARGNTNFFAYPIPEFESEIVALYITYVQYDEIVLEKTLADVDFGFLGTSNNHVLVRLTQEETLKFKHTIRPERDHVEVQIRIKTKDGEAYHSRVMNERVHKTLKEGVI